MNPPEAKVTKLGAAPTIGESAVSLPPILKADVVEIIAQMLVANLKRKRGLMPDTVIAGWRRNRSTGVATGDAGNIAETAVSSRKQATTGFASEGVGKGSG